MAKKNERKAIEWVGGVGSLPGYVTGEGEPYRPEALFWMAADGAVLGHTVGTPGELLGLACESLRNTMAEPMLGPPHAPDRVRVASPELAEALRAGHPKLDVVCAPTPELDAVFEVMRERLERDPPGWSYLSPEVGPEAVAAFFHAAAVIYRAQPWKVVPSDMSVFSVSIEKLGVREAALSITGQMGENLGLVLFPGFDEFEAYVDAADAIELGKVPKVPAYLALNFEDGRELDQELQKEIAEHRWEVESAEAYPLLSAVNEDLIERPPVTRELTVAEAIALALPRVLEDKDALFAAWSGGEPVERTLVVETHSGEVEVRLRAPHPLTRPEYELPEDVFAELAELAEDGEVIEPEAREMLEQELMRRFAASPEANALTDVGACQFVMDFAAEYFNATIPTLDSSQLQEIVFDIIPRKVSIDASSAASIIGELRDFYRFLEREFELEQADACLRVLGGDAVKELAAALSDPSKFGMAKTLMMKGREAGFDMSSKAGVESWMRVLQSQPLPDSFRLPSPGPEQRRPVDQAAARAKKNARKAARKARKKNR